MYLLLSRHDIDKLLTEFLSVKADELEATEVPVAFISFPSSKDPEWEKKFPGNCMVHK